MWSRDTSVRTRIHECIDAELKVDQMKPESEREFRNVMVCAYADDAAITGPSKQILTFADRLSQRLQRDAALTVKEHIFHPAQNDSSIRKLNREDKKLADKLSGFRLANEGIVFAGNPIGTLEFINQEVGKIVTKHDSLESRLHSAFCFIFLFQGSRFLLGVFRGSCLSHDSSLG